MKLFSEIPDIGRIVSDTGLEAEVAEAAILELAWITKTITRLGKGYLLGGGNGFSRPGSAADAELDATRARASGAPAVIDALEPWRSAWVQPDELAMTLAHRTGLALDDTGAIIDAVGDQVDEFGGPAIKVATKLLELERVVEDQLMDNPAVLEPWGWAFEEPPRRQVRLEGARLDLVGRLVSGEWLVVELKRGAAVEPTAAQILRYLPLVRAELAGGDDVKGLVIADGDDIEFHQSLARSTEGVDYLPVRCLNLPACRPQTHRTPHVGEAATLTVAADGITAVAATPNLEAFTSGGPPTLTSLGRLALDGTTEPIPIEPLQLPADGTP